MALWQFHCYIIPRENRNLNEKSCDEDILSWKKHTIPTARIDFLEKQTSWTEDIVQYGKDDETCIQFLYEEGLLEEISCRLDLRSSSRKMLEQVMEYINKIEGMILYENKIYFSNINDMVELIKKSNANKFCQNPMNYFDELSKK